jgi:hypothetical protein
MKNLYYFNYILRDFDLRCFLDFDLRCFLGEARHIGATILPFLRRSELERWPFTATFPAGHFLADLRDLDLIDLRAFLVPNIENRSSMVNIVVTIHKIIKKTLNPFRQFCQFLSPPLRSRFFCQFFMTNF